MSKLSVYLLAPSCIPCPSALFCFARAAFARLPCLWEGRLETWGAEKGENPVCSHFPSAVSPPGATSPVITDLWSQPPKTAPEWVWLHQMAPALEGPPDGGGTFCCC